MSTYNNLSDKERDEFIAKLIAAMQHYEGAYTATKEIVNAAEERGLYKKVKIGHEAVYPQNDLLTVVD